MLRQTFGISSPERGRKGVTVKGNRQGMINEFYMNQDGYSDPTAGYALQKLYREQLEEMRRKELEAKEKEQKKSTGKAKERKRSGNQDAGRSTGTHGAEGGLKKDAGVLKAEGRKTKKKARPEVQVAHYPDRKRSNTSGRTTNPYRDDRSKHHSPDASGKGGSRHD